MNIPEKGTRIELTSMSDDPDPVPRGTRGTVTFASEVAGLRTLPYVQIGVRWDNGRTLGLVCPPDGYRMLGEEE